MENNHLNGKASPSHNQSPTSPNNHIDTSSNPHELTINIAADNEEIGERIESKGLVRGKRNNMPDVSGTSASVNDNHYKSLDREGYSNQELKSDEITEGYDDDQECMSPTGSSGRRFSWSANGVSSRLQPYRKSPEEISLLKKREKEIAHFYENQNSMIDTLLEPLDADDEDEIQEDKNRFRINLAIRGSLVANMLLFSLQLVAAISSGSLSILATMTDAFMDLLSSVTTCITYSFLFCSQFLPKMLMIFLFFRLFHSLLFYSLTIRPFYY